MSRARFTRPGLTVVEAIAAGSVLSLVLGLVIPGISSARSAALIDAEKANLRVLAQLMATYAARDPDGVLGPIHPRALNFYFAGYAEYGGGPGTMPFVGWGQEFDPRTRPFNQLLYGQKITAAETMPGDTAYFKPFQCLGDDFGWQRWPQFGSNPLETETPYFKGNGVAFRLNNLQYEGNFFGGGMGGGGISVLSVGLFGTPASRVPSPSQTLAFSETRVFQTLFTNDVWGYIQRGELEGNHGRRGYFLTNYADGHADYTDFGDDTYYEHVFGYWEYDARGTWGRFDTMPLPLGYYFGVYHPIATDRSEGPSIGSSTTMRRIEK
ncbi:MAG: hypothetical protein AMXMBFR20_06610 [Planctomycetia bacterium]|nr:hypothetical protein [Planctomycetota bacterium]